MSDTPRRLIWIASYPKSGNTWLRACLANYLKGQPGGDTVQLDYLVRLTRSDISAAKIADASGTDPSGSELPRVYAARQIYLEKLAAMDADSFIKTHMPNAQMGDVEMIPSALTKCAIYVVRNPLDILPSFSDQLGMTLDEAVVMMGSEEARLAGVESQIQTFLGNWSMHVRAWFAT